MLHDYNKICKELVVVQMAVDLSKVIHVKEAKNHVGKEVAIRGWVYRRRSSKNVAFVIIRDSTGIIQCVTKQPELMKTVDGLFIESSLMLQGTVKEEAKAPGGVEIAISHIQIIQNNAPFPITKDHDTEFLLDNRHLWLRSRYMTTILKLRNEFFKLAREYFDKNSFYEVTGPMFVGTKGEEGGQLFEVKYFGKIAYLSQTDQMHLEAATMALEKVYSLVPSFRAEKSRTRKHLTEFWHLEGEEAWVDLEGTMRTQENLVAYLANGLAERCPEELESLNVDPKYLKSIKTPFKKITYAEALDILQKKGADINWLDDLGTEHERLLMEDEKQPVFITHWPRKIKAFYMKLDENNPELVKCADLQAPFGYGEIIGGSEREIDPQVIIDNLKRDGDDPARYKWYIDLRTYGGVPHSGFGLGVERVLAWMLQLEHIRDAIPFPRTINRISP